MVRVSKTLLDIIRQKCMLSTIVSRNTMKCHLCHRLSSSCHDPRPPNAADEWRKHYATVRARLGRQSRSKRALRSAPRHFAGSRADARTEQPEVRSMKSRNMAQHDRLLEMRISRLTRHSCHGAYFHITVAELVSARSSVTCPRVRSQSILRARFCARPIDMPNRAPFHRDHATVIRACRQVAARVATDAFFAELVSTLRVYWRARKRSPSYLTQSKPSARQSSAT